MEGRIEKKILPFHETRIEKEKAVGVEVGGKGCDAWRGIYLFTDSRYSSTFNFSQIGGRALQ